MDSVKIGGRKTVNACHVVLLESDINYSFVHLIDGKRLHVATTLKELEQRFLPFDFFVRTSKSHVINALYVINYSENSVLLQNKLNAVVSRRRKHRMERFNF